MTALSSMIIGPNPARMPLTPMTAQLMALKAQMPDPPKNQAGFILYPTPESAAREYVQHFMAILALRRGAVTIEGMPDGDSFRSVWGRAEPAARFILKHGPEHDLKGMTMVRTREGYELTSGSGPQKRTERFRDEGEMFLRVLRLAPLRPVSRPSSPDNAGGQAGPIVGRLLNMLPPIHMDFSRSAHGPDEDAQAQLYELGVHCLWTGPHVSAHKRSVVESSLARALRDLDALLEPYGVQSSLGGELSFSYDFPIPGMPKCAMGAFAVMSKQIILRKTRCLAHEWFHALDSEHGAMRGGRFRSAAFVEGSAFALAAAEIAKHTGVLARSAEMDSEMGADYWTRPDEVLARCFEVWVDARMSELGLRNDHLGGVDTSRLPDRILKFSGSFPTSEERATACRIMDDLLTSLSPQAPSSVSGVSPRADDALAGPAL